MELDASRVLIGDELATVLVGPKAKAPRPANTQRNLVAFELGCCGLRVSEIAQLRNDVLLVTPRLRPQGSGARGRFPPTQMEYQKCGWPSRWAPAETYKAKTPVRA